MNRRTFLSSLAALPFVGRLVKAEPKPEPETFTADWWSRSYTVDFQRGGMMDHSADALPYHLMEPWQRDMLQKIKAYPPVILSGRPLR